MLNYRKIDSTPQERISNAIVFSKDKPKGFVKPEVKELTVLQDGIDFKVVFKIYQSTQRQAPTGYDSFITTHQRNITDCRRCSSYNRCKAFRTR